MSASEKLKALDAAATQGPWGVYEDVEMSGGEPYPFHRLTNDKGWLMSLDASDLRKPDAQLMAALRSALPQIVAVVEAAEFVRTDIGMTVYEGTPVSVSSGKSQEKRLSAALTALESALGSDVT